jgi:uncharacterized protein with HEPN domain
MNPDDRVRLQYLLDALNWAMRFTQGRRPDDLETDELLLFALTRAIEIAGEAASRVTAQGRAILPEIPWNALIGMRNRLVHAYFDVDRDILWKTATAAAPPLAAALRVLLANNQPDPLQKSRMPEDR